MSSTIFRAIQIGAILCLGALAATEPKAETMPVHVPSKGEGFFPQGGVKADARNRLYGVVQNSSQGRLHNLQRGCGIIYRLTPTGSYATLLDFSDLARRDGCRAGGEILVEGDALYGITYSGGQEDNGTIYRLSSRGRHQVLHRFSGQDGRWPVGGVTRGIDGKLYGITSGGGEHGAGTLFRVGTDHSLEVLFSFQHDTPLGSSAKDPLVLGDDGALYGASLSNVVGKGSIFRITPTGAVELVHSMTTQEGCYPSGLSLGRDGWLYGAAMLCGRYGLGTLFRVHPDGRLQTLHHFSGPDGSGARDRPTQGPDGAWYGTTIGYLEGSAGTLYRFRPEAHNGVETLHLFNLRPEDGVDPVGPVLPMVDGAVYGTTQHGGNAKGPQGLGPGMVYRYPPLPAN